MCLTHKNPDTTGGQRVGGRYYQPAIVFDANTYVELFPLQPAVDVKTAPGTLAGSDFTSLGLTANDRIMVATFAGPDVWGFLAPDP